MEILENRLLHLIPLQLCAPQFLPTGARFVNASRRARLALHDEVHEVLVVDVALRVLLPLQQLLHLRARRLYWGDGGGGGGEEAGCFLEYGTMLCLI
ncbi:jg26043 [Pararge aegeria aegeria]|uniref:Jg26043 protein n=1 Tax=Pararge aegeria aegeria TaxID=348720 RepID=A0A8S4QXT1_9NEOP|nr:jg26043 [Pararge aegeria aegeria]